MIFRMPHFPCQFEIPDEWIAESGLIGFTPARTAYLSDPGAPLIALTQIEPLPRFFSTPKDHDGFDRQRLTGVLKGIVAGHIIPPVPMSMFEAPEDDFSRNPYQYRVLNGFHRYYASIAAGFSHLPGQL
jgi:hypothetical protein